jgi:hypothetical protein
VELNGLMRHGFVRSDGRHRAAWVLVVAMLIGLVAQGFGPLAHERWCHGEHRPQASHEADAGSCRETSAGESDHHDGNRDEHRSCRVCDMLLAAGRLVGGMDGGAWAAPDAGPASDAGPETPWRAVHLRLTAARQRGPPAA